eukprot:COSAG01_NODE_38609_length_487_cov_1.463918_1_plen_155_part_01
MWRGRMPLGRQTGHEPQDIQALKASGERPGRGFEQRGEASARCAVTHHSATDVAAVAASCGWLAVCAVAHHSAAAAAVVATSCGRPAVYAVAYHSAVAVVVCCCCYCCCCCCCFFVLLRTATPAQKTIRLKRSVAASQSQKYRMYGYVRVILYCT